jgi:hypothetical protein
VPQPSTAPESWMANEVSDWSLTCTCAAARWRGGSTNVWSGELCQEYKSDSV